MQAPPAPRPATAIKAVATPAVPEAVKKSGLQTTVKTAEVQASIGMCVHEQADVT